MQKEIFSRNSEGVVSLESTTIKIPTDRLALPVLTTNQIVPYGDYRSNGFIYVDDKPVKKWHEHIENIRLWTPKLEDTWGLYYLYRQTHEKSKLYINKLKNILQQIWDTKPKSEDYAIAYAKPTHDFQRSVYWKSNKQFWKYTIKIKSDQDAYSYGFDWVDGKPKKLINYKLGQLLYQISQYHRHSACRRFELVKKIFFKALEKKLPDPQINRGFMFHFNEDIFLFVTEKCNSKCFWRLVHDEPTVIDNL